MSIAAINFLSTSATKTHTWLCNTSRRASAVDPEAAKVTQEQKKVRKHSENDLNHLTVPSENYGVYGSMNTQDNRLARRASILGVLANQIGPPRNFLSAQNMSNPVLEQTTLSDFLKILDSVHHKVPLHLGDTVQTVNEAKPDRQPAQLISLFQNHPSNKDQQYTPQRQTKPNNSTKLNAIPISDPNSQPITSCLINSDATSTRKRRQSLSPMSVNWYPTVVTPRNRRASFAFVHSHSPSSLGTSNLPTLYQEERRRSKSSSNIDSESSSSSIASSSTTKKSNMNLTPPKIYVVTPGQTSRRIRRFSVRQCEEEMEETYRQKKSD